MNTPVRPRQFQSASLSLAVPRHPLQPVKVNDHRLPDATVSQDMSDEHDSFAALRDEGDAATSSAPAPAADADAAVSQDPQPVQTDFGDPEESSCQRDAQNDDDRDDCGGFVPFPWLLGGAGGLALAGIAFGGGSTGAATAAIPGAVLPPPVIPPPPANPEVPPANETPPSPAGSTPVPPLLEAPRLSTSSGKSTIDPAGHVEVLLSDPQHRWVYRLDGTTTWIQGEGHTIPAGAISKGIHAVTVAQVDELGRIGEVATLAVRVHAPNPTPELALANDTGAFQNDSITSDGTIVVTGLANDAPWYYRVNGDGAWTLGTDGDVPSNALKEGRNVVEIYQEGDDPESTAIQTLTVLVDQTAPDRPVLVTNTATSLLNASGSINLSQLEQGATWEWRLDGGEWHQGQGMALSATDLHQGHQTVDVRQIDLSGNVSDTQSMDVSVDLAAPGALSAAVLRKGGAAAPDNLINASGYLSIGALEPNAHWEFKVGSDDRWRTGNENGTLTSRYFDEGSNVVLIRQVNEAGNAGAETRLNLELDTIAPVITIAANKAFYFSDSAQTMYLNLGSEFSVRSDNPSTSVQFAGRSYNVGSATWAAAYLNEGSNTLVATATDKAGNVTSRTFTVYYDGTPPTAPGVSLKNDTGASSSDAITSDGTILVQGLSTGDKFRHSEDNGVTWSNWTTGTEIAGSVFGADGEKAVLVQAMDSYGNIGAHTSFHFTLDSTVL